MAPSAHRIEGPTQIRHLQESTRLYLSVVVDTSELLKTCLEEGQLGEREELYSRLLVSLASAERGARWVIERTSVLLGENIDTCPVCASTSRAVIRGNCGHKWHYGGKSPMESVKPHVIQGGG